MSSVHTVESRRSPASAVPDELLAQAWLIRAAEQKLLSLFAEGKLFGTVHTCIGQEFSAVAVGRALKPGDQIFSNHRCHGHYLAHHGDVDKLIAEVMGRQSGLCGGRGGSQHLCGPGFYSNGVQGGIVPVSAGLTFAEKLRGTNHIVVVFLGDGTLGEGAIYEAMNLASKWELPLWFVLENNGYAQSTSQTQTLAGDINARAAAFGIPSETASTDQPTDLLITAASCANTVRTTGRPVFLRIDTHRLMAHSKGDDDRNTDELRSYWALDSLARLASDEPERSNRLEATARARVDLAVQRAEQSPFPSAPAPVAKDLRELHWTTTKAEQSDRLVNRLYEVFRKALQNDPRVVLIGEDIEGPYGGAFKVTKSLSQDFPGRVRNTPISESAIVGMGNGLALSGFIPVVEVMFGDFLTLSFDQLLNHASKFRYTYNDQVTIPLIVRTPMGGKRGYGATHSQSIEKHFLGMPDTQVLALHHRIDPSAVYGPLFKTIDRPTLVIENKLLYTVRVSDQPPCGFCLEHSDELFPTTRIRPAATPDVTILCYGGMLPDVEKALEELFDEYEIACQVICPTRLYPFDVRPLAESVAQTGRLLIVEEGISFAAFGAEAVAALVEQGIAFRVRRVGSPEHPIPSCGPLEKELLPGVEHVVTGVTELCDHG